MPEATEGPTVLRILLGTQLRRLRESRGITAQAAAKAIRGSESKISRIELGRNAIREIDVLDLLTFYGVGPVEREQLLTLAEQANRPGWWHRFNDILPDWFQSYVGMEEAATSIRVYEPQLVPGLLQIPTYTAAVLVVCDIPLGRSGTARHPAQGTAAPVHRRAAQALGHHRGDRVAAAGRQPGDPARSAPLPAHLSDRPNFTLQIIPAGMGGHAVPSGFTILRFAEPDLPDVAYLEHLTSALYFDKKSDVDRYLLAMERLSIVAAKPGHTTGHPDRDHRRAGGRAVAIGLRPRAQTGFVPALGMSFLVADMRRAVAQPGHRPPLPPALCPWSRQEALRVPDRERPRGAGTQATGRSNSPFLAPMRKHSHSCRLNTCGSLAAVLRIADRHASRRKMRDFHAPSSAACAALEPAQAVEVGVHPSSPFG